MRYQARSILSTEYTTIIGIPTRFDIPPVYRAGLQQNGTILQYRLHKHYNAKYPGA
eukprot:COSAG02_NODE_80_length_40128_cov_591.169002_6_plen_56_part_00